MSQRPFSFPAWIIRLAAFFAGLLLLPRDAAAQGPLTLTLGTTAATCETSNGTITASASGGQEPYTFELNGLVQPSGDMGGLPSARYYVTVIDFDYNTVSYFVIVSSGCLTVQTDTRQATCGNANGVVTVHATGGLGPYSYSDDNGTTFQPNDSVFNGLAGGTYTFAVFDQDDNETTTVVEVGDILGPTVTTTTTPASCLNNDGTVGVNISGGNAPILISFNGGAYGSAVDFSDVASGNQDITVKDGTGCVVPVVAVVPLNDNLSLYLGDGLTICQGTSTALPAISNAASFLWTPADGLSNPAIANPVAQPSTTTTYQLTATLGICTQTESETITVLPAPIASAGPADTICPGKSTSLQGSGGVTYLWQPSTYLNDPEFADPLVENPTSTVVYSLTVYGANGCASINPVTEQVFVTPAPVVFAGDDTAVLSNQPVPLDAIDVNNSGFTQYAWAPATGLNNAGIQNPVAQITANTTYTVTATTAAGCVGTSSITIDVQIFSNIIVPNAFTPNHDGHNDILRVDAIGIRDFKYFSVYNRWGQEVFTTSNPAEGWDGTRGGQVEDTGTYVWAAMGLDFSGRTVMRRGTVILIR